VGKRDKNLRPVPDDGVIELNRRELTTKLLPKALARVAQLLQSADEKVAVRAANIIIQQALGKPKEAPDGGARPTEELAILLAQALREGIERRNALLEEQNARLVIEGTGARVSEVRE